MKTIFLFIFIFSACVWADDIDYLQLAGVLIKDQRLDRVPSVLEKAEEEVGPNHKQLLFLKGHFALQKKELDEALRFFRLAQNEGFKSHFLPIYRAQVYFQQGKFVEALDQLALVDLAKIKISSVFLLKSQCHWGLKQYEESFAALESGVKTIPLDPAFLRQKVLNWMDLGLYEMANSDLKRLLPMSNYALKDMLYFAQKFEAAGQKERSLYLKEEAHLRYHDDALAWAELASHYLKNNYRYVSAELFQEASLRDDRYGYQAAELFRQMGYFTRTQNIVANMIDPKIQAKQKLALMIETEKFNGVKTLERKMKALGLTQEEDMSYALSYALYKSGHLEDSKKYLKSISSDKLFSKAVELRKVIDQCEEKDWSCYEGL